jgi:hypothetical protein
LQFESSWFWDGVWPLCSSAVAANNVMAMITRLQAEKAVVQMEALQYQRMMEEQAEYDQDAIHILP